MRAATAVSFSARPEWSARFFQESSISAASRSLLSRARRRQQQRQPHVRRSYVMSDAGIAKRKSTAEGVEVHGPVESCQWPDVSAGPSINRKSEARYFRKEPRPATRRFCPLLFSALPFRDLPSRFRCARTRTLRGAWVFPLPSLVSFRTIKFSPAADFVAAADGTSDCSGVRNWLVEEQLWILPLPRLRPRPRRDHLLRGLLLVRAKARRGRRPTSWARDGSWCQGTACRHVGVGDTRLV